MVPTVCHILGFLSSIVGGAAFFQDNKHRAENSPPPRPAVNFFTPFLPDRKIKLC
jgi:hypothetical protein